MSQFYLFLYHVSLSSLPPPSNNFFKLFGMLASRSTCALLAHLNPVRRLVGGTRAFTRGAVLNKFTIAREKPEDTSDDGGVAKPEHAVISTFDLFSIGGTCLFC